MTMPARWSPIGALIRMDPFLNFDDFFRGLGTHSSIAREYERTMDMRLDVNEDDNEFIVNVDMPGVKKSDIDVSIDGNQITVRAEVRREKSGGMGKEIYNERYTGQAFRSFSLPMEVDSGNAKAIYDGGVLTLTLPKKAGGAAKRLSVG